jgi:hypothetical protein
MSTSTKYENLLNSFRFSKCSIKNFKENILVRKQYDCVLNTVTHDDDYMKLTSFIPGQLYNADQQCKQLYGEKTRTL